MFGGIQLLFGMLSAVMEGRSIKTYARMGQRHSLGSYRRLLAWLEGDEEGR